MSQEQIPLFDQRPGVLNAASVLVDWPISAIATCYDGDEWHVAIATGRVRLHLTIEEAKALQDDLAGAIISAEFGRGR